MAENLLLITKLNLKKEYTEINKRNQGGKIINATQSASSKHAVLETGITISVP